MIGRFTDQSHQSAAHQKLNITPDAYAEDQPPVTCQSAKPRIINGTRLLATKIQEHACHPMRGCQPTEFDLC
jgi:hypothetical protein